MWPAAFIAGVGSGIALQIAFDKFATNRPPRAAHQQQQHIPPPAQASVAASAAIPEHFAEVGLPAGASDNLRVMEGYVSSINFERRIPNWVLERIVATGTKGKGAKKGSDEDDDGGGGGGGSREGIGFYVDEGVPEPFRATNADYATMGFSRGHLAAAQFHKSSQADMNQTFNLSANVVPQDMTMNACDWFRLESMTKKLAKDFPGGLFVLTGPLFVPTVDLATGAKTTSYRLGGTHDVAIPTHMFKVVLGVAEDKKRAAVAAFVMPNGPIVKEQPLTAFQVPVKYVEQVAGLQVFPRVLPSASTTVYDMCSRHKCEGSYASFGRNFREIGRIRAATSKKEADEVLRQIAASGTAVDEKMKKAYEKRIAELAQ